MNSDHFSKEISVLIKTGLNSVVLSTLCVVVNILNNVVEQFITMLCDIEIKHNYSIQFLSTLNK